MSDWAAEDIWAILDALALEILADAEITEPPVDSSVLARHLGIKIEETSAASRSRGVPSILRIDPDWPEERRQLCIAQGVARYLRDRLVQKLGETEEAGISGLTNRLAEHLLVPRSWFRADAQQSGWDLSALRKQYRTANAELLAERLLAEVDSVIVAMIDGDRVIWRRGNGVRANRQLTPAEEQCRQSVRETGEAQVVRTECGTVQGWPLPPGERIVLFSRIEA